MSQFQSSVAIRLLDHAHRDDLVARAALERPGSRLTKSAGSLPRVVGAAECRRHALLAEAAHSRLVARPPATAGAMSGVIYLRTTLGRLCVNVGLWLQGTAPTPATEPAPS